MANIVIAAAALRIRSAQNQAVCSISGVNPNMSAADATGFVSAIQAMYNRDNVTARIHVISDIEIDNYSA
ncbi:MAG: hypothetical protein FWC70_03155 [Defluviitaleaceae bacterium]|nr:hypothetical protein [Defluviitaleaceae bacterium]